MDAVRGTRQPQLVIGYRLSLVLPALLLITLPPQVWSLPVEEQQVSSTYAPPEYVNFTITMPKTDTTPTETPSSPESATVLPREPAECAVFADYGKNYLTPIDILVKSGDSDRACIKARFALAIKVEEAQFVSPRLADDGAKPAMANLTAHPILGYVPLEHVVSVEESCPENLAKISDKDKTSGGAGNKDTSKSATATQVDNKKSANNETTTSATTTTTATTAAARTTTTTATKEEDDELEMIVTFDCGKLAFTFKRDDSKFYVSAIKGIVKLDRKVVREFVAVRPMFLTSDLNHHFKYDDMIEVVSEVQSKAHILTANFYFTEFEAFRTTASREFEKPPDSKSKPVIDE